MQRIFATIGVIAIVVLILLDAYGRIVRDASFPGDWTLYVIYPLGYILLGFCILWVFRGRVHKKR